MVSAIDRIGSTSFVRGYVHYVHLCVVVAHMRMIYICTHLSEVLLHLSQCHFSDLYEHYYGCANRHVRHGYGCSEM